MKTVKKKVQEYEEYCKYFNSIYNIFKDYYGESRVDIDLISLSDYFKNKIEGHYIENEAKILIYYPEVIIKNEHDDEHLIKDLYIQVIIDNSGKLVRRFRMNRASYTESELNSDYMHSHAPGINWNYPSDFKDVCTGSGPINTTMATLMAGYNEDIWRLFTVELDCYTKVESLSGVPYRRMSSISSDCNTSLLRGHCSSEMGVGIPEALKANDYFTNFIFYLLKNNLIPTQWNGTDYKIALSRPKFYTKVTEYFIEYYVNTVGISLETLINSAVLIDAVISQCEIKIASPNNHTIDIQNFVGKKICIFKGKDIKVSLIPEENSQENKCKILNIKLMETIYDIIYTLINLYYGKHVTSEKTDRKHTRVI